MKIFQIGFNRCGTRTIHEYLKVNGIRSIHWDGGKLAKRMFRNLERGKGILSGYERYQAFSDMEWLGPDEFLEGYKLYPQLAANYPDAVFILNSRDREAWIRSRFDHAQGRYAAQHKALLGLSSDEALAEHWRREWDAHHRNAIDFFAGRPQRFCMCKIETDLPDLINRMLPDCDLNPALYNVHGVRGLRNKAQLASIMRRNRVAMLRNERGFPMALVVAAGGLVFGVKSLFAYLDSSVSLLVNSSERGARKQLSAASNFTKMLAGFKGLSGENAARSDNGDGSKS